MNLNINQPNIRVGIIIASYNEESKIKECIESILNQTYKWIDLIIIDGGSSDKTTDILSTYDKKIKYWISEPDHGIYDAWNKGITRCNSDYVYFMGCDDRFEKNTTIEKVIFEINQTKYTPDIICGKVKMMDKRKIKSFIITPRPKSLPYKMLPHQGVFQSYQLFSRFGLFDDTYKIRGDLEFTTRCFSKTKLKIKTSNLVVCTCELGGFSNAWKYSWLCFKETLEIRKKYKVKIFTFEFSSLATKSLIKTLLSKFLIK